MAALRLALLVSNNKRGVAVDRKATFVHGSRTKPFQNEYMVFLEKFTRRRGRHICRDRRMYSYTIIHCGRPLPSIKE